jgi:predicted ATP-dependent serine protease
MALRAKKPEAVQHRLKMFMFGPAGVGKTTAAIQFPNSYIIDSEKGTDHYSQTINASGSVVYQSTIMDEVIAEVKALLTEKHAYRTLVIDPVTTLYNDLLEKCEKQVGADFGRHYGAANKVMKRLANLIMQLDMNVVITAHAKAEYGESMNKIGYTFDGWKQLDYWFDLVIELAKDKKSKKRYGKVVKTRLEQFPDQDVFEWSYESIRQRYDVAMLEKEAQQMQLATPAQVSEIKDLLNIVRLPEGVVDKWFAKAGVDLWEDMPAAVVAKCLDYVKNRLPGGKNGTPQPALAGEI